MDYVLRRFTETKFLVGETAKQSTPVSLGQRVRGILLSRAMIRASWIINATVLLGSLFWILYDGKFAAAIAEFNKHISAIGSDTSPLAVVTPLMWPRVDALWVVVVLASLASWLD
jgi:hypothetical protein